MSRNLSADCCVECGYGPVLLFDLVGHPAELRAVGKYAPVIGARFDCPRCHTAYFAHYYTRGDCPTCHETYSVWSIDLSYWSTYNDEPDKDILGLGEPRGLILNGREEQRADPALTDVVHPGMVDGFCPCGRRPSLDDIAGQALEFRALDGVPPRIGVRGSCSCGAVYFIHYRTYGDCIMCAIQGRFAPGEEGSWQLDLYSWADYSNRPSTASPLVPKGIASDGRRLFLTSPEEIVEYMAKFKMLPSDGRSRISLLAN